MNLFRPLQSGTAALLVVTDVTGAKLHPCHAERRNIVQRTIFRSRSIPITQMTARERRSYCVYILCSLSELGPTDPDLTGRITPSALLFLMLQPDCRLFHSFCTAIRFRYIPSSVFLAHN